MNLLIGMQFYFISVFMQMEVMEILIFILITTALVIFFLNRIKKIKDQVYELQHKNAALTELFDNSEDLNKQLIQEHIIDKEGNDSVIEKMSYEIHNYVNVIMGTTILLKDTDLNMEQTKFTNEIIRSSNKLLNSAKQNLKTEIPEVDTKDIVIEENELSPAFAKKYPLKILVVEDDAINRRLAIKLLEKIGYNADAVSNGKETLEAVSQKNYDVILMDIFMPEMDGYEVTKMIRLCLDQQPLIIALTASVVAGEKEKCIRAGMNDYLYKPILLEELMKMLIKWATEKKLVF